MLILNYQQGAFPFLKWVKRGNGKNQGALGKEKEKEKNEGSFVSIF